jgi:hypothetical protein
LDMVSTISFIQANLQHSIAASRLLSRTASVKGIDMAGIQELWHREGRIRGLNVLGHTLFSTSWIDLELVSLRGTRLPGFSCRD